MGRAGHSGGNLWDINLSQRSDSVPERYQIVIREQYTLMGAFDANSTMCLSSAKKGSFQSEDLRFSISSSSPLPLTCCDSNKRARVNTNLSNVYKF